MCLTPVGNRTSTGFFLSVGALGFGSDAVLVESVADSHIWGPVHFWWLGAPTWAKWGSRPSEGFGHFSLVVGRGGMDFFLN